MNISSQKSPEWPVFKCSVFRKKGGQWKRYSKQVQAILQGPSVSSLTVRDVEDGTLVADFPKDAVRSIECVRSEKMVRIHPSAQQAPTLALQFSSTSVINSFIQELKSRKFVALMEVTTTTAESSFEMPDLRDSAVQDLILNLQNERTFETRDAALAEANSGLAALNLAQTKLPAKAVRALAKALAGNKTLTDVRAAVAENSARERLRTKLQIASTDLYSV